MDASQLEDSSAASSALERDSIKLRGFPENLVWLDGHRMAYSLIDEVHVVTVLH